jgi:hypothetical protein
MPGVGPVTNLGKKFAFEGELKYTNNIDPP